MVAKQNLYNLDSAVDKPVAYPASIRFFNALRCQSCLGTSFSPMLNLISAFARLFSRLSTSNALGVIWSSLTGN